MVALYHPVNRRFVTMIKTDTSIQVPPWRTEDCLSIGLMSVST